MGEVWRDLAAEISALGWRCFAFGPEFWAGVGMAALFAAAVIAIVWIWRG